jgi:hypothetical protein
MSQARSRMCYIIIERKTINSHAIQERLFNAVVVKFALKHDGAGMKICHRQICVVDSCDSVVSIQAAGIFEYDQNLMIADKGAIQRAGRN